MNWGDLSPRPEVHCSVTGILEAPAHQPGEQEQSAQRNPFTGRAEQNDTNPSGRGGWNVRLSVLYNGGESLPA